MSTRVSTALYRRYRPETFADVIGQEHVTQPLMQALRTGRVNHAYLFSGPRGCGKTTSARILARCLNCEQGPTPEPCGRCESCVALARGGPGSIDVIEIDAASHGGVDDARDLRERASFGPAQSRYKVYIIDEAHMVTTQGFNALLKIVEEPPEHVKFVFATTEPEKVIGTIRSRTHHYPFRLVPPQVLQGYLDKLCQAEGVAVEPGVLSFVVRAGAGSVRDSLSVLDQLIAGSGEAGLTYDGAAVLLGFTDAELLDATVDALAAGDAAGVFKVVDRVIETGLDPRRFVEDLLERLRDLIVVAAVPDGASSVLRGLPEDQIARMRHQAAAFGQASLSRAADIVNAGLTEMTGATAPRLQLELIAARVLLPGAAGESGYAVRLDRLERRLEVGGVPVTAAQPPSASIPPAPERPTGSAPTTPSAPTEPGDSPEPAETAEPTPASPGGEERQATATESPAEGGPPAPRGPGGIDTAAIRRSWPDILGWIYRHKRATWTLLSEHAVVHDYDGERVVLEIATVGLANTFRAGSHAELVRQAMIDVLGVDARVEGIPAGMAATPSSTGGPDSHTGGMGTPASGSESVIAWDEEPLLPQAGGEATGGERSETSTSNGEENTAAVNIGPETGAGSRGSGSGSAGGPSSGAADSEPATREAGPASPLRRAMAAVHAAGPEGLTGPRADDSAVSHDDEDVDGGGEAGRSVVERLLGGQVIQEGPDPG